MCVAVTFPPKNHSQSWSLGSDRMASCIAAGHVHHMDSYALGLEHMPHEPTNRLVKLAKRGCAIHT